MTGFGGAVASGPAGSVRAEVRSVNHRTLKVSLRVPAPLAAHEAALEAQVRGRVARGALHVDLAVERRPEPSGPLLDTALARAYANRLADMARELGIPGEPDLALLASLPGVVLGAAPGDADREALARTAETALRDALAAHDASRAKEGKALLRDFESRAARISRALARVEKRSPRVMVEARRRLARRVAEVLRDQPAAAAAEAVAREAVLLAQRSDVTEEVTRLRTHIEAFLAAARAGGEVGRRLDFLLQEMLREVNTIGSKSQDAALAAAVVDMKVEVDRMKEQAANVE